MEEQISKKDLLKLTKISYGQLYRWKREKLIPEEWFIKQASVTGQETYFPKNKVLMRVSRILEWKDRYSLEEMAAMLSPEFVDRLFSEEELDHFVEINLDVAAFFMDLLNKDEFTFREIIWMMAFSIITKDSSEDERENIIKNMLSTIAKVQSLEYTLALCNVANTSVGIIYQNSATPLLDARVKIHMRVDLQDLSQTIKAKYQSEFHFINE